MIGVMVDIQAKQFGQQEKNKKKYIKGVENPYRLYYYYSVTREKIKKAVCDNDMTLVTVGEAVLLERAEIQGMGEGVHTITIELDIA